VQSIREGGDAGEPAALNEASMTGLAFADLAQKVVECVEKRNATMPETKIVEMKK
jgi:ATP-binding protein involved in chromosome partitioning